MNRRDFLKATGAVGLFVTFPLSAAFQETEKPAERPGYPKDFNAYLRIGPDGRVGCFVGKIEMGQGSMTALAMLAAEELDVPLERVDMLMGDTDLCPWDQGTWGSRAPRSAVAKASAAPARCSWMARRCAPAPRLLNPSQAGRCSPSRGWNATALSIPCSRPSSRTAPTSAGSARRA